MNWLHALTADSSAHDDADDAGETDIDADPDISASVREEVARILRERHPGTRWVRRSKDPPSD